MKAAGEVVPQALPPALTCFLPGLLTLRPLASCQGFDGPAVSGNCAAYTKARTSLVPRSAGAVGFIW
jgi:hypothetical protein